MRTPSFLPLKLADLTVRRTRADVEARSILRSLHQDRGAVFCIAGIESPHEEVRERIFLMCAQHIEHLAQTIRDDHNPARAFEHMLAKVNDDFARLGPELELRKDKCHVIFAVCAKNQLFLSGFGNLLALFLHKTADRRFSIYELHTQLGEENASWEKPCSVVLDGELHEGDVFYVATHVPATMLSPATLQDILVTLPAKGALERIEGFIPPAMPFAGVAIQVSSPEHAGNIRINPLGSLDVLQKNQERTADVLGERPPQRKETGTARTAWMGRTDVRAVLAHTGEIIWNGIKGGATQLMRGVAMLFTFIKERVLKYRGRRATRTKESTAFTRKLSRATASPLIIVLVVAALVLAGGGGWFLYRQSSNERAQNTTFSTNITKIEEYLAQAEGSLIYNNTAGATQALQSAQTLLAETHPATEEQQNTFATTTEKVTTLLEKSQGITRVSPTVLASLPEGKQAVTGVTTNSAYLFSAGLEVFRFNGLNAAWEAQPVTLGVVAAPKLSTQETATSTLLVDSTNRLARYQQATQTLNPLASGVDGLKSVEDMQVYNNALYILVAADQQIVKMRPQGDGYEAGTAWINARSSDLTDAKALTVDGSVYILTSNNVRVFFSGKEQTWTLGTLNTPLNNPVDIFTTPESKELSILDPQNKRIIIVDKTTGTIVAQYVNDAFAQGITLSVDETANTMSVLTPTSLLQFTPNHLVR